MLQNRSLNFKLVLVLLVVVFPRLLHAEDAGIAGFNGQLFRPQTDGYGIYNVSSSQVLPHLKYSFGMFSNYSKNVLSVTMPARRASLKLVNNNISSDFSAALGLFNFMDVGINVPVTFFQDGNNFNTLRSYSAAAVGDLRFDIKFRILKDKPGSLGVGFLSSTSFPTGSRYKFTGDRWLTWEGRFVVDKSFKPVSLFANVGYRVAKSVTILATNIDDRITFGGGLAFPIPAGDRSWSLITEVYGETVVKHISKTTTPIEVRGGVRKKFKSGIMLNLGGGGGVTDGMGAPDFRIFAGISFNLADRIKKLKKVHVIDNVIYFDFGKYNVKSSDYAELRKVGQVLARNPEVKVDVNGHTDSTGPVAYNKKLSEKRAGEVGKYLVYFGADEEQIFKKAYGEQRPAANNGTPDGRRENRRVEIKNVQNEE